MKIAVLSDTRFPTAASYPGHGLGKMNLAVAEGLLARGHEITLYAGYGSEFAGHLIQGYQESEFYSKGLDGFDAIVDGGHEHKAQEAYPDAPIINVSHDREHKPGRCAVFVSEAHKAYHKQPGRVIYNGVDVGDYSLRQGTPGTYLAWMALMMPHKGPHAAIQAAGLAGVPLKMAGPGDPLPNTDHIGPVVGAAKIAFLHGARALLVPAAVESGGLVCLEAAACGVPVVAYGLGGLPEYVAEGVTGFLVDDVQAMADAVANLDAIEPPVARVWVERHRALAHMVDAYEQALEDVANGERW